MKTYKKLAKSKSEIRSEFAAVFDEMKPDEVEPSVTLAERLEPYRTSVLAQRRRNFSWELIAKGMNDPRIGEKVSGRILKKLFGGAQNAPAKAPKPAKAAAPKKPKRRLVKDPVTGLPKLIDPPSPAPKPQPALPPAPAAPTPGILPQYQALFDALAAKIIKSGYVEDDAETYLVEEMMKETGVRDADVADATFVKPAMAALDALEPQTAVPKYKLTQEQWTDWRTEWDEVMHDIWPKKTV